MKFVLFYHSLLSDWNHGNAHFLRGIVTELRTRGHEVCVFEPHDSWSLNNLLAEHGCGPIEKFHAAYPGLETIRYHLPALDLDAALDGASLVLVHEWNAPELIRRLGEHRRTTGAYRLFFHDTHHRMISAPESMAACDLSDYDGVLAYGRVLRDIYAASGRVRQAWTWHEAADTRIFRPSSRPMAPGADLVWIGNWGDGERTAELHEYLIQPCRDLGLKATVYGVRYPEEARDALSAAGMAYGGWLPNFEVPRVFATHKVTVHVPRRPYLQTLRGIPTIRPFEAMACGIPLICSPWEDTEHLFRPGYDFLVARDGAEMKKHLRTVLNEPDAAREMAAHGLEIIRARHTCAHRVDELLRIHAELERHNGRSKELRAEILVARLSPLAPAV